MHKLGWIGRSTTWWQLEASGGCLALCLQVSANWSIQCFLPAGPMQGAQKWAFKLILRYNEGEKLTDWTDVVCLSLDSVLARHLTTIIMTCSNCLQRNEERSGKRGGPDQMSAAWGWWWTQASILHFISFCWPDSILSHWWTHMTTRTLPL